MNRMIRNLTVTAMVFALSLTLMGTTGCAVSGSAMEKKHANSEDRAHKANPSDVRYGDDWPGVG